MNKILICAVPYSDNLGDGVIAQSLEYIVRLKYPNAEIEFLDIAGRSKVELGRVRSGWVFAAFQRSPSSFRAAAVLFHCLRSFISHWRSDWGDSIRGADLVIIGGGQLLCDVALNFPTKLFLLGTLLRGKETVVLSVGVTARWSAVGRYLVNRFLSTVRPKFVSARDAESLKNLKETLGYAKSGTAIIHDPGLLCGDAFHGSAIRGKKWDVGVCISDLDALAMNSEYMNLHRSPSIRFFELLTNALVERNQKVIFFTNGAAEDNAVAKSFVTRMIPQVELTIPNEPSELVSIIGQCRVVVAHRLHANIVAYGLNIPSVGLNWDKKVESFLRLTGRTEFLFPMDPNVDAVAYAISTLLKRSDENNMLPDLKMKLISDIHAVI